MKKKAVSIRMRPARMNDARTICSLINYYAERGRMLHRSLESVYDAIREFQVACEPSGRIIGCVALDTFWADLAEIKSLAVANDRRRMGIGRKLLLAALRDARRMSIRKVFALTYEQAFFESLGFKTIGRDHLPEKVWTECIYCPKADACDEIAMMRTLSDSPAATKKRPAAKKARAK